MAQSQTMIETMTCLEIARRVIQKQSAEQTPDFAKPAIDTRLEPLEDALAGHAIELWSDALGRLFLVADEADARAAIDRLGARRGEVYTAAEVRRIVAVNDPAVVAEIHDWKRQFNGALRDFCRRDIPK